MHISAQVLFDTCAQGCRIAGTVNYVKDVWSPISAQVDCLGSGDDDIDREGRCASRLLSDCSSRLTCNSLCLLSAAGFCL